MIIPILQALAAAIAAFGIFAGWRRVSVASRPIYWIVTGGVLVRAIGGQLAFWISYLSLPIGRSLQIGEGLWVFALDGKVYTIFAVAAARAGFGGIVLLDRTLSSVSFVQILATAMLLFGAVASVGIVINLAAYLGCCKMVLSLGRSPNDHSVIVAVAALSLMPSSILWSLQPLKDLCFLFLVAAFFAAAYAYQELWRHSEFGSRDRTVRAAWWMVVLFDLLYGISGIRWYFGMVILPVSALFLLLVVARSDARLLAAAHSAVLFVVLCVAFYASARPLVPAQIRRALEEGGPIATVPGALSRKVSESRTAFDRTGAATLLGAGTWTGAPVEGGTSSGTVIVPSSPWMRLAVGTAAVVLPRSLAQRLGLLNVRGGHGLWGVAEVDTICFDAVLLFTIVSIATLVRRGSRPTPLFWMVLLVTGIVGMALVYTVSNFGTLFRHRDMLLLGLVFLPLAMAQPADT